MFTRPVYLFLGKHSASPLHMLGVGGVGRTSGVRRLAILGRVAAVGAVVASANCWRTGSRVIFVPSFLFDGPCQFGCFVSGMVRATPARFPYLLSALDDSNSRHYF